MNLYTYQMIFNVFACFGVSFCTVLPSVCLGDILLGLGSIVATFWEKAAHLVYRVLSLYFDLL